MKYIQRHIHWQRRVFPAWLKVLLVPNVPMLFLFFLIFLPGWWARSHFPMSIGLSKTMEFIFGFPVFLFGLGLYIWTIVLFARAKGTQVPMVPTQRLVSRGPYGITRNPMVTSGMFMVTGLGFTFDSWSFILAGLTPFFTYLIYILFVEERELEKRFGEEYSAYRKRVPFIIPKLFRREMEV